MKEIKYFDKWLKFLDKITNFNNEAHNKLKKTNYLTAKKKILFVIADSGGGHRASANAVKGEIEKLESDICVFIMPSADILAHPQRLYARFMEESYNKALQKGFYWLEPLLFTAVYLLELPLFFQYVYYRNSQILTSFEPDSIVSFVPGTQNVSYYALKYLKKENTVPIYTVVTDLVSMRSNWIIKEQEHSFVPTEATKDYFSEIGIPKDKMTITGLPVNPSFFEGTRSKTEIYNDFNINSELFIIMIMMGGNGSNCIYTYSKMIEELNLPIQIIACCGKNKKLKIKLDKFSENSKTPIKTFGFTKAVAELMKVSNLMITKPGPGAITEAISQSLPLLIDASSFTMWQERGNPEYVEDNKIGMVFRQKKELKNKINELVNKTDIYNQIKENMTQFTKQNSAKIIAQSLINGNKKN